VFPLTSGLRWSRSRSPFWSLSCPGSENPLWAALPAAVMTMVAFVCAVNAAVCIDGQRWRYGADVLVPQYRTFASKSEAIKTVEAYGAVLAVGQQVAGYRAPYVGPLFQEAAATPAQVDAAAKAVQAADAAFAKARTVVGALNDGASIVQGLDQAAAKLAAVRAAGDRAMGLPMGDFAAGRHDVTIPTIDRADEIGAMAGSLQLFKQALIAKKAADEAAAVEADAKIQRGQRVDRIASDFEAMIGEIVEVVASASTELETFAGTLTATAERSEQLTTMGAAVSEQASTNEQSVASATEEMSSSVNEISRRVQGSARIANGAVEQAQKTNHRVAELAKAAARIGDVAELINNIAGQTNLLALNPTIKAARAGEAGRGFAVVASEVKALAEQTAKATGEISQQINGIQAATQESVGAIKEIGDTIGRMSEIASTIAAAVEEQGAATLEISRNVQQAAHGTQQVSANIVDLQRGASETGSASAQVLSAAKSLSDESDRLKREVGKFLNSVRAA
jgi:methyl-accepting chemotaxis protein